MAPKPNRKAAGAIWRDAGPARLPSRLNGLYLPEPVYEALRKVAFEERVKIHDLVIEGIDAALRRRGYPSIEILKAAKKGRRPAKHSSSDGQ
jgi:hypothetical protein